jgi:hypothetical protein
MWILPKQLHTSPYVPDTEALISDLNEQSQACAQSLLVRSKVSPARTWSLKWKRDSWTRLLSGRILKPSLGPSFTAAWISSVADTRASHSVPPASVSVPTTPDTSGRTYQPELPLCDRESVSSRMSKDTLPSGCATCCKTWAEWVTERRGAWRARVNAVRLTSGSVSLSWPTVTTQDSYNTPCASQMERNTPPLVVAVYGPLAPASSNTSGSRQGLWRTPQANEAGAKVETLFTKDGAPAMPGQRAYRLTPSGKLVLQSQTINQQVEMVENWATPQAHDAQGPKTPEQIAVMRAKGHGVKNLNEQACWGTPTARDHKSGRGNNDRDYKELTPMVERTQAGKLNPRWVETLMGLPIGWTMPSCTSPQTIAPTSFGFSGTELSPRSPSEPSEFLLAS